MNDALQQLLDRLTALLAEKPLIGAWYTTVVRFVFPLLGQRSRIRPTSRLSLT